MAKDWEYWKNQYIEDQIQTSLSWFKRIENQTRSPIENIACLYLREFANNDFPPLELEIFPQFKLGNYTVDFLVEHHPTNVNIIIECDGHEFHEKTKKQAGHDKKRDRFFTKRGFYVLRYTGSQICENPLEIIKDVEEILITARENARNIS